MVVFAVTAMMRLTVNAPPSLSWTRRVARLFPDTAEQEAETDAVITPFVLVMLLIRMPTGADETLTVR